jgi:hypothetical protein
VIKIYGLDPLVLGNAINLLGVAALVYSNYVISLRANTRSGFLAASWGGGLVAAGSMVIGSYPVVLLNVCWAVIGAIGVTSIALPLGKRVSSLVMLAIAGSGILAFVYGNYDLSAYATSAIYVVAFLLFSMNSISRPAYLAWSLCGFVMLVPHLLEVKSVFVLANETLGFVICSIGLVKCLVRKKTERPATVSG